MNNGIYGNSPNALTSNAILSMNGVIAPVEIRALVVGGGGSGGGAINAFLTNSGGGAGGALIERVMPITLNTNYIIVVGAGAASAGIISTGFRGSYSRFGDIIAQGGGAGYHNLSQDRSGRYFSINMGGAATPPMADPFPLFSGFLGGVGNSIDASGGGAGSGGNGFSTAVSGVGGAGGLGAYSLILDQTLAGGGGGGLNGSGLVSSGNNGGGNGASTSVAAKAGDANSGGGGGGGAGVGSNRPGAAGGSGIVALRFSSALTWKASSGLIVQQRSRGSETILIFTGGTGTITFS